ncbi:MAG: hypothetical protein P8N31_11505 [Planctomycetota bacterium]|nr:hypothetical protein [Planctomycetota bacterium]MDG2144174.1 hypothetical protein [Planctomycetota bacterium]
MYKFSTLLLTAALSSFVLVPSIKDDLTQEQLEAMTSDILDDIEEMRGKKFLRGVDVALANKEGFLKYAMDRTETMTTPERLNAEETVMKMLGLLDPSVDFMKAQLEMLEEQVGGFYDPATESFCLMDSFQGGLAKIILAHELTHALDDQLYDIDGTLEELDGIGDAQLAYQAVVEGSGTTNMNQWLKLNIDQLSMEELSSYGAMGMDSMKDAPECMWKPTLMVYMRGAAFLVRSDNVMVGQAKAVDLDDLHQAFSNPPRSTEQILHPEKYWDEEQLDEPMLVKLGTDHLDGWKTLYTDTLGEAQLALVTTPPDKRSGLDASDAMGMMLLKYTNRAAEGWGGDRYVLMRKDDTLVMHMVTVWDTQRDAEQFYESIASQADHLDASLGKLGGDMTMSSTKVELMEDTRVVNVTFVAAKSATKGIEEMVAGIEVTIMEHKKAEETEKDEAK